MIIDLPEIFGEIEKGVESYVILKPIFQFTKFKMVYKIRITIPKLFTYPYAARDPQNAAALSLLHVVRV